MTVKTAARESRKAPRSRRSWARALLRLSDPSMAMASLGAVFLGACAAAYEAPLSIDALGLSVLGVLFIEFGKNASNEVVEFDAGTDVTEREEGRPMLLSGKRTILDGLLTRWQAGLLGAAGFLLAITVGLSLSTKEPDVLWLGVLGMGLALSYYAEPFRLAGRGLGEAAVFLCYGPLIGGGTYLVQRGDLPPRVLLLMVPFGLAVAGFLWVKEIADYSLEAPIHRRNLVVRMGRRRAARLYPLFVAAAAAGLALLPLAGLSPGVLLGLFFLAPAFVAGYLLLEKPEGPWELLPIEAIALQAALTLAIGAGAGLLLY